VEIIESKASIRVEKADINRLEIKGKIGESVRK